MNERENVVFRALEIALDFALNFIAVFFGFIVSVFFGEPAVDMFSPKGQLFLLGVLLILLAVYPLTSMYKAPAYRRPPVAIREIFKANIISGGLCALFVLLFFRGDAREFTLLWTLIFLCLSTLFLCIKRRITIAILRFLHRRQIRVKTAIILEDNGTSAAEYVRTVSKNPQYGIALLGSLSDVEHEEIECERLGTFDDLPAVIKKYKPDLVVFAIDSCPKERLIHLVNLCDDNCVKVYFLPLIYGYFKSPRQLEQFADLPLINIHANPLNDRINAALKRSLDLIGSLLLILVSLPVMLGVAIGIKISMPGPVFFKQKRVGIRGKPFYMFKFRSMVVNADSNTAWTTKGDPRITRFGAFLRSTALDELPQLFNVLIGNMSLVGPRPEIPKFVRQFRGSIPLYMVKHSVKPGMTGLAQVRGLRGDTSVEERIRTDITYIENWSFGLDLYILLITPFRAFNKNERYNVSSADLTDEEAEGETKKK